MKNQLAMTGLLFFIKEDGPIVEESFSLKKNPFNKSATKATIFYGKPGDVNGALLMKKEIISLLKQADVITGLRIIKTTFVIGKDFTNLSEREMNSFYFEIETKDRFMLCGGYENSTPFGKKYKEDMSGTFQLLSMIVGEEILEPTIKMTPFEINEYIFGK